MSMTGIISIVLIYAVILVIIIMATYFVSRIGVRIKLGYWLLGGYSLFLIGSVILYTLIPTEEIPAESELAWEEPRTDIRHQIAYRGVDIESLSEYKMKEWNFPVNTEETVSLFSRADYYLFPILIKEVKGQEDVRITLYYDKPAFDFEEVTGDNEIVDIIMENSEIRISPGYAHFYEFAHVAKEFPFIQFSENESRSHYTPHIYTGEFVLYVEMPADLNMEIAPHLDYEYVN